MPRDKSCSIQETSTVTTPWKEIFRQFQIHDQDLDRRPRPKPYIFSWENLIEYGGANKNALEGIQKLSYAWLLRIPAKASNWALKRYSRETGWCKPCHEELTSAFNYWSNLRWVARNDRTDWSQLNPSQPVTWRLRLQCLTYLGRTNWFKLPILLNTWHTTQKENLLHSLLDRWRKVAQDSWDLSRCGQRRDRYCGHCQEAAREHLPGLRKQLHFSIDQGWWDRTHPSWLWKFLPDLDELRAREILLEWR